MPWLAGIDEAGYGPNLGPFVMSAVVLQVPEGKDYDVWKLLQRAVRRATGKADGRLIVDDSKEVYSPRSGLGQLARHLAPWVSVYTSGFQTMEELWNRLVLEPREALAHEPYVQWQEPVCLAQAAASSTALLLGTLQQTGIEVLQMRSSVVSPRAFNGITQAYDSKAAVPLSCVGELLHQAVLKQGAAEEKVFITVDRLGGRQRYLEQVKGWFPGHTVQVVCEEPECSAYEISRVGQIRFLVQADQHSFPVALASMLSKYWRELFMQQFNGWFSKQQPGVAPTAGYPVDAARFWQEVLPTRERLQLRAADWWRER